MHLWPSSLLVLVNEVPDELPGDSNDASSGDDKADDLDHVLLCVAAQEQKINQQRQEAGKAHKEAGEKYLAENAKKDGVITLPSGLQYQVLKEGNGKKPSAKDSVKCHYEGFLIDGTVFDETPEDAEPARLMLNRVIPAWTEGLQLIGEGGKIQLTVPSKLGYGERGTQGIEPNSTLLFDVELTKVGKFVEKAE